MVRLGTFCMLVGKNYLVSMVEGGGVTFRGLVMIIILVLGVIFIARLVVFDVIMLVLVL